MNAMKIGRYLAVVSIFTFIVYTICVGCILLLNPPFHWTNLPDFVQYSLQNQQLFKHVGMLCMLIFGCAYPAILLAERISLDRDLLIFGDIACAFALAFCICIGINYFVQLTATRLQILDNHFVSLEQFTQSFPISALNAINMLGWSIFYGLSTLLLFCAYQGTHGTRMLRCFCLANSIMMFAGAVGYAFNISLLVMIAMNLGLGATTMGILLCIVRKSK